MKTYAMYQHYTTHSLYTTSERIYTIHCTCTLHTCMQVYTHYALTQSFMHVHTTHTCTHILVCTYTYYIHTYTHTHTNQYQNKPQKTLIHHHHFFLQTYKPFHYNCTHCDHSDTLHMVLTMGHLSLTSSSPNSTVWKLQQVNIYKHIVRMIPGLEICEPLLH